MNADEQIARAADQTVLIVDDDSDARELLAEVLELMVPGITTLFAQDGRDALAVAVDVVPWVVVLDLDMPRLNGDEAAAMLRARMGSQVPILIAVSGDYERLRRTYDLFDYSLGKPVESEKLADYLARAMSLRGTRPESC